MRVSNHPRVIKSRKHTESKILISDLPIRIYVGGGANPFFNAVPSVFFEPKMGSPRFIYYLFIIYSFIIYLFIYYTYFIYLFIYLFIYFLFLTCFMSLRRPHSYGNFSHLPLFLNSRAAPQTHTQKNLESFY